MALADDVQNRVPTHILAPLTRINDKASLTVDTAYLAYVVADGAAMFKQQAGAEYSSSNVDHVPHGVAIVVLLLEFYNKQLKADEYSDRLKTWKEAVRDMSKAGGARDRTTMASSSELTLPEENESGDELPPSMNAIFDDSTPPQP